ncbi:hypothetical protein [Mycolicibacterium sp. CBMA 334]|uniref:hypothetical protein n=1 Tax=Mycolicibacterium sp. CBMA 334 TaxID=2606607 RepID=UPI0012DEEE75|nr:hypothetical protein [Mycolicibacterium sp. CBMA 334]
MNPASALKDHTDDIQAERHWVHRRTVRQAWLQRSRRPVSSTRPGGARRSIIDN